jgi:ectoine hydroxylase-related dioxygenase (phytanoyl-CoA dioxygenase family)
MPDVERDLASIEERGYVVLESLLNPDAIAALEDALEPFEQGRPMGRNAFEGERSRRVYSLAAKGEVFLPVVEHPRLVELLDRLLLPNWLLSTYQSIRLYPGERAQAWHTDDAFYLIPRPRGRLGVSTIWALEDFTEANGATQVIPGSHLWAGEHPDDRPHEVVSAVMPAGSAIVFDAALWHRGGENRSAGTRLALSPQYCQPWLRPQESQLLIVPPERAERCTPRVRAMLGYSIHPPFIGQVDGMNPLRLVDPHYSTKNRSEPSTEAKLADQLLARPASSLGRP